MTRLESEFKFQVKSFMRNVNFWSTLHLCLSKTQAIVLRYGNILIIAASSFSIEKLHFQNVFRPHKNEKVGVVKFLRFEEQFWKAPFSWRISVDGRPNRRNKVLSRSVDEA